METIKVDLVRGAKRLRREMNRHVEGCGTCVVAELYEEAKGGGWLALFDCEFAALKAFYVYRNTPGVNLTFSTNLGHWAVTVKS